MSHWGTLIIYIERDLCILYINTYMYIYILLKVSISIEYHWIRFSDLLLIKSFQIAQDPWNHWDHRWKMVQSPWLAGNLMKHNPFLCIEFAFFVLSMLVYQRIYHDIFFNSSTEIHHHVPTTAIVHQLPSDEWGEAIHDAAHFGHLGALAELVEQRAQPQLGPRRFPHGFCLAKCVISMDLL